MPTSDNPTLLRQRATELRRFARQISTCDALTLAAPAGHDTWIGPTPDAFRRDLVDLHHDLAVAADRLTATAQRLDRQADALQVLGPVNGPR